VYARSSAVMSTELLDAIVTANAAKDNLPLMDGPEATHHHIGPWPCATFHAAVIQAVREMLRIPAFAHLDVPDLIIDFPIEMIRGEYETEEMGDRLQRGLMELVGEEPEYWDHVAQAIIDFPIIDSHRVLEARLVKEIGIAKSSLSGDKVSPENGSGDKTTSWMSAAKAAEYIGVTSKTIQRWIKEGTLDFIDNRGTKYEFFVDELNAQRESRRKQSAK